MKFYQLAKENMQLINLLEREEITQEDFEDNKEMLQELIKEKAVDLILVNHTFDSDIAGIDEFIKRLQDKKKSMQSKKNSFNEYVKFNMELLNIDKIDTPLGKIQIKEYSKTTVNEQKLGTDAYDIVYKIKTQKELKELGYDEALEVTKRKELYIK